MNEENSFLGKGWSFPPTFDNASGEVQMLRGEDDIQSSLRVLLATKLGERVMQPLFGCNLDKMVFELLDTTLKTEMKNLIERAILFFEPRINIDKIEVDSQNNLNGVVIITVNYVVRSTNTRGNLVFPFYLSEV
ncbi:MAG TPA: GPW/gp25 family protein [Parafilimonas sp.]|nr:GPW/gp25 family protein [Parafilimonas sp.]